VGEVCLFGPLYRRSALAFHCRRAAWRFTHQRAALSFRRDQIIYNLALYLDFRAIRSPEEKTTRDTEHWRSRE
jgi:hypothetical protein